MGDSRLRDACSERCAEYGEPPCYEIAPEAYAHEGPCTECLKECGIEIVEPIDPNAAIGNLL
jgi:hypothetical protein